jgi:hypothetical protein
MQSENASDGSPDENAQKKRYRPPLTILAVLAPIIAPLGFALLAWAGVLKYVEALSKSIPGAGLFADPMIMFMYGWIGLTIICAGWLAWRVTAKASTLVRVLLFILLWPMFTATLGAVGAGIGIPACLPELR